MTAPRPEPCAACKKRTIHASTPRYGPFARPKTLQLELGDGPYVLINGRAVYMGKFAEFAEAPRYAVHGCPTERSLAPPPLPLPKVVDTDPSDT